MPRQRIDFSLLKERADCEAVLRHYGVVLAGSGAERSARCPFHDDRNPSFSVNVEKKVFQCFACGAKGDLLDFVARMERSSIREAAAVIAACCGIPLGEEKPPHQRAGKPGEKQFGRERGKPPRRARATRKAPGAGEEGNTPLPFTLPLEPKHPYLDKRGVSPEVVKTFGLGYCNFGLLMKGRICIPIHDERGNLVAYAGRWPGDEVPEGEARYLLPWRFKKRSVLYNLHRVAGAEHLVIVEGYWSVFRLHATGIPAVALMGRTLSEKQEGLLLGSGARLLTLFLDGDAPGREATAELLPRLARHFFVRAPTLPKGEAPDTVNEEILTEAVRVW